MRGLERSLRLAGGVARAGTAAIVAVVALAFVAISLLALASDEIGLTDCSRRDGVNHRC